MRDPNHREEVHRHYISEGFDSLLIFNSRLNQATHARLPHLGRLNLSFKFNEI